MKRDSIKITQKTIDGLKPQSKGFRVHDHTVKGLSLYVGTGGSKTWSLTYVNRDGNKQTYRIGSTIQYNVIKAREKARALMTDIAGGGDPAKEKREQIVDSKQKESRTLNKYLSGKYWNEYLESRKDGKATQARIAASYKPFLNRDMKLITSDQLKAHRAARLKSGRAKSTLNRERIAIHGLFEQAIRDGILKFNPANKNDLQPYSKKEADIMRVRFLGERDEYEHFPLGERERFNQALATMPPKVQAIVRLAMYTGCRRSEILTLKWGSVSLVAETMTIEAEHAKTGVKRTNPLNPTAVRALKKWKKEQGNVVHIDGLVFPSDKTGKRLENINRQWGNLISRAELSDFKYHDMRHDFASRLVQERVPLIEIMKLMGHADIESTMRYAHLNKDQLRKAIGSIG